MAYSNTSSAYDFEAFERPMRSSAVEAEAPVRTAQKRRKNNVVRLNERDLRRSHRRNANALRAVVSLCCVMVVLGTIGAVIFGQVQLTELTAKINSVNTQLAEQKGLSVQLEMQAAALMNTDEIETYARERLGMEKVTEGQTTYINLAQSDTGTVLQDNEQPGVLKEIWNSICSIFS
ncbi:MAG: hypothetical protein J6I98_00160 [Clostridia bacterium]|nr:hypothetical protein [Clostridia bacterium]